MAYTGIIVTEAEMNFYAGENVDATGNTEANHNILAGQAEAYLTTLMKYDIATNWASLDSVKRKIFSEYAGRFSAVSLISYNMAGYTSRIEAEDMINIHVFRMQQIENLLSQASIKDFLKP